MVFKTGYCLMQVNSIAECSKGSILQCVRPSAKKAFALLYLSGRLRQVLLYVNYTTI